MDSKKPKQYTFKKPMVLGKVQEEQEEQEARKRELEGKENRSAIGDDFHQSAAIARELQLKERERLLDEREEQLRERERPSVSKKEESRGSTTDILKPVIDRDSLTVGDEIGYGGEADVKKGMWLFTEVAVKVFRGNYTHRCDAECAHLLKLHHPNIVSLYGVVDLSPKVGIVMELCECSLATYAKRTYNLRGTGAQAKNPEQAKLLKIVKDALCGLIYVHAKEIIHMDIKPSNILIKGETGKLADFGLSGLISSFTDMSVSHADAWPGTPLYKAPELYHRSAPTKMSDMWCFGLTLLEVMTGQEALKVRKVGEPDEYKKRQLPGALGLVESVNRGIYTQVLNYDTSARQTAEQWMRSLGNYVIVDLFTKC